jgi:hypothetical protein
MSRTQLVTSARCAASEAARLAVAAAGGIFKLEIEYRQGKWRGRGRRCGERRTYVQGYERFGTTLSFVIVAANQ